MFARLLVPLDQSLEAAAALPAARTLAQATGSAITLVRATSHAGNESVDARRENEQAEDELRAAAKELSHDDLRIDWLVRSAPAAASIIEAARVSNADVIVMATHGRSGLSRAFAGSVSERVVADSGRPVLLVRPDGKHLEHIATLLVPIDGTAGGVLGLGTAVGLARATGARLILLDVVAPTPTWMYSSDGGFGGIAYFDPTWEEEALQSVKGYVEGMGERLRKIGLQVDTRAVRGDIAATIRAVADETDTDIVVMSTHALTGPARAVLGSVADAVVRTSHHPVLLVRRPAGTPDTGADDRREPTAEVASSMR